MLWIKNMLESQKRHISFHTPGHKRAGADITELSYSDNLQNPTGVLARAEADIARILGADKSFLLTDGSTCGVFSMVYTLTMYGVKRLAVPAFSHASVKNACRVTGIEAVEFGGKRTSYPLQPTEKEIAEALQNADALLLTSPDYYGFFPPLKAARDLCTAQNKPLIVDGAHGSHLHFTDDYAGKYADLWVDGVHKSLPALTQGAVVSARGKYAEALRSAVSFFRTSSPSYPIMASVEYAVKYPRDLKIERLSEACKREISALKNDDWSKILVPFGTECKKAQEYLERRGVFPEFSDGNFLMFYSSPCTKPRDLKKLVRLLKNIPRGELIQGDVSRGQRAETTTWVPLSASVGRTCAQDCGLFPPCVPLLRAGERFSEEDVKRLSGANVFGVRDGAVLVYTEELCGKEAKV